MPLPKGLTPKGKQYYGFLKESIVNKVTQATTYVDFASIDPNYNRNDYLNDWRIVRDEVKQLTSIADLTVESVIGRNLLTETDSIRLYQPYQYTVRLEGATSEGERRSWNVTVSSNRMLNQNEVFQNAVSYKPKTDNYMPADFDTFELTGAYVSSSW